MRFARLICSPRSSRSRTATKSAASCVSTSTSGCNGQVFPKVRNVQSATALLDQLWAQVASVGDKARDVATVALFVDSANRVISLNAERVMLRERSRIPRAMDAVLILLTVLSFAGMGYHGGVAGTVRSPVMVIVAVSFSLVVMLIADLNRPGQGWINVSQDAMIDLRNSLNGRGQ